MIICRICYRRDAINRVSVAPIRGRDAINRVSVTPIRGRDAINRVSTSRQNRKTENQTPLSIIGHFSRK